MNSYGLTLFFQRRLDPCPHDIINGQFVSKDNFLIFIYIDDSSQACVIQTKIVEE